MISRTATAPLERLKVLYQNKKNIVIIIEDDGPGVPENKRLDVFKAFYRIDKSTLQLNGCCLIVMLMHRFY